MREIKFRAWDKACERMVNPERHVNNWRLHMDGTSSINDVWATSDLILMQFTGLQDVNGVDIYEGDILRVTSSITTEVVSVFYFMGNACFRFGLEETGATLYPTLIGMRKEVIGNIHENPELTK